MPLIVAEGILLLLVFVGLPLLSIWTTRNRIELPLKGLGLPQGSVRSMLALTVVGSFVIFLVFGGTADHFTEIVAALTGVAGTIIGFYFGSGGSGSGSSVDSNGENSSSEQENSSSEVTND